MQSQRRQLIVDEFDSETETFTVPPRYTYIQEQTSQAVIPEPQVIINTVVEVNPLQCTICQQVFARKSGMTVHMNKRHPAEESKQAVSNLPNLRQRKPVKTTKVTIKVVPSALTQIQINTLESMSFISEEDWSPIESSNDLPQTESFQYVSYNDVSVHQSSDDQEWYPIESSNDLPQSMSFEYEPINDMMLATPNCEPVCFVPYESDEPMSLMCNLNHTYEMILNIQEFNECITKPEIVEDITISFELTQESEVVTINKCNTSKHCESCTCFQQVVEVSQISAIRKNMQFIDYITETDLSLVPIRDVCLKGLKMLETDTFGGKLFRDVTFKFYESEVISKRITKTSYPFVCKRLSEFTESQDHSYLNFKSKINNYEAVMKYSIENDIQYTAKTFEPTMIAYDIEAFHPSDKTVVPTHRNGGIMSMICASFSKSGKTDIYRVYVLDQYTWNEETIKATIVARRQEAKHPQADTFDFNVISCENQTILACAFLDDVKQSGVSIMYGFNSSTTVKEDQRNDFGKVITRNEIGYDLPFIIHCSGRYTKEEVEFGCKLYGKIGRQIRQISWLPNVYILDCSIVFQNSRFFAMNLSDLPNRKLNSFLEFAEIPQKIDDMTIHERMQEMRISGSDMSSTISYCMWDAYALTLVMNKIQFLESVRANVEIFNIPLSWALFKNATAWITMYMLRSFYKNGYAFSYAKFPIPAQNIKFQGATCEQCPSDLQQQVISNILMGDYESLYPNAIILANLGIDSVLEEASMDCYKINLNFVDKYLIEEVLNKVLKGIKLLPAEENLLNLDNNPKWVYFSKNSSLYALIVKQVLEQRLATKALMGKATTLEYEQLDARQNALKIMVNTIYGLSGCKTFQLYDERVAAACTAVSRNLTEIARESSDQLALGRTVFRDTDSCGIMGVLPNVQEITQNFTVLNNLINEKLALRFTNTHRVKFVAEVDTYQVKTYYPIAKKAYARLEMNLKAPSKGMHLKVKGVSWSLMSQFGKSTFKEITEYILMNFTSNDDIKAFVDKQVQIIHKDVLNLIETQNFEELANKYHKQIKNSSNNKTAAYLRKQFNMQENELQILPIVKACKQKSQCVIPAKLASMHKIDTNQLIDWFLSPIVKFFGKQAYDESIYDSEHEALCELRVASQTGYYSKNQFVSFDAIEEMLQNTQFSYNEVIKPENKLFFDIDDAVCELNFKQCIEIIQDQITKFRLSDKPVEFAYTKSNSKSKPYSYHVVFQLRCTLAMNKYIADLTNERFPKIKDGIIDAQLYSQNKSLRLPYSPKYDKSKGGLVQVHHVLVQGTLQEMFVTQIDDLQSQLSSGIGFIQKPHRQLGYTQSLMTIKHETELKQYIPFEYTLLKKTGNCVEIVPNIKPYTCVVCKRNHESLNMKLYVKSNGFKVDCWSNTARTDKTVINHKFPVDKETYGYKQVFQQLIDAKLPCKFDTLGSDNVEYQNQPLVAYNLNAQATFVCAGMGTGKSEQQMRLTGIDSEYKTILALSFRRTFARDNAHKNGFTNYEDIKGPMNLYEYPRLIVQVDSLTKLDISVKPKLLIIDEIESVIEQLIAIQRDTTPYILHKFIELLKSAEKVLFMDAELQSQTVQVMTTLMGTDNFKVFVNEFKLKTESNINLYEYAPKVKDLGDKAAITNQLTTLLESNKRVVVSCSSQKLADTLRLTVRKTYPNKVVKFYDGQDAIHYTQQMDTYAEAESYGQANIVTESMANIKLNDFKDVNNTWDNVDVLIYTSTLTAGVSFQKHRFDSLIGVYSQETCTPLAFTQGLHRVRNLTDKQMYIYLEQGYRQLPQTAYELTELHTQLYKHCDLSEVAQFNNWIQASNNQSRCNTIQLIIMNLKNMGYQMQVDNRSEQNEATDYKDVIKAQQLDAIVKAQITLQDVLEIPKLMKQTNSIANCKDTQLHAKYQKVKLFKTYYELHTQENIDHLNSLNDTYIEPLIDERKDMQSGNRMRYIIKKCLNVTPTLKDVTLEQSQQLITAIRLEAKGNLNAQLSQTVQKDDMHKHIQDIFTSLESIKLVNQLNTLSDINTLNLQEAVKIVQANTNLKKLGFKFTQNGNHHKLNEILKYSALKLEIIEGSKKVTRVDGKQIRTNSYVLVDISIEQIITKVDETIKRKGDKLKVQAARRQAVQQAQ